MKRYFSLILLLILMISGVNAQVDRSLPPKPGPAPEVNIGDYKTFRLPNGLTVIVVENHKVPVVSYSLTLDVTLPREADAAGYIQLAGELLRAGTTNRTKAEIDEAVDFIGASLQTYSKGIYGRSLTKHSEELLSVMSDVLLNPTFPQEELDKLITQYKTSIQANKQEARAIAENVAGVLIYGKEDPYAEIMTEESLDNVTVELCRNYYESYFRPGKAYLVIVGDISVKEAKKQAKQYFGKWKDAPVPQNLFPYPNCYDEPKVVVANKEGAEQSVVMVTHEVMLPPGNPDAIKARVMNAILGGGSFNARLFQNLREDKAFTYGAYSQLETDERVGRFSASAEVRTSVTDSAITEILKEMERMRTEVVTDEELQLVKNVISGTFGRSLEDPQTVARFALNIERYNLPKDYYETYLQKVEKVTKEDVREMAMKYLKPERAVILAVGDVSSIKNKMKKFSPSNTVEEYDYYGNLVETKAVSDDVTPSQIISAYIDAIGGRQALGKVNDLKMAMAMEMQGMPIEINYYQKRPNKMCQETLMNGNVVSMQVFDGEKGKMKTPMGEQMLEGKALEYMKESALIFPELSFLQGKGKLEVEGVESLNGIDVYKVIVTKPSGLKTSLFFGVDDGLKYYKEVTQTPQGTVSTIFEGYENVDGILFPLSMKQTVGPQMFEIEVKSVEVNSGIDDSRFEVK